METQVNPLVSATSGFDHYDDRKIFPAARLLQTLAQAFPEEVLAGVGKEEDDAEEVANPGNPEGCAV